MVHFIINAPFIDYEIIVREWTYNPHLEDIYNKNCEDIAKYKYCADNLDDLYADEEAGLRKVLDDELRKNYM